MLKKVKEVGYIQQLVVGWRRVTLQHTGSGASSRSGPGCAWGKCTDSGTLRSIHIYLDNPSLAHDHTLLIKSPVNHHLSVENWPVSEAHWAQAQLVQLELVCEPLLDEVGHKDQQGLKVEVSSLKDGTHEQWGRPAIFLPLLLPDCHGLITPKPFIDKFQACWLPTPSTGPIPIQQGILAYGDFTHEIIHRVWAPSTLGHRSDYGCANDTVLAGPSHGCCGHRLWCPEERKFDLEATFLFNISVFMNILWVDPHTILKNFLQVPNW